MKKIIYLLLFIGIHNSIFSQAKLRDGIYLIDQSGGNHIGSKYGRTTIQFNPSFVEDEPENYEPVVIRTNDFVAFELKDIPLIQYKKDQENILFVHLTENATEKLKVFTGKNIMNEVAVVIDGQALAIYQVAQPVTSGLLKILHGSSQGCLQIYERLKSAITPSRY